MPSINDRRSVPRYLPHGTVVASFGQQKATAFIKNLSEEGLMLETDADFPLNTFLTLALRFGKRRDVRIEARVARKSDLNRNGLREFGLLIRKSIEYERMKELYSDLDKCVIPDRRTGNRRTTANSINSESEKRTFDRRGSSVIRSRLSATSRSLNRWGALNTYHRVLQSASGHVVSTDSDKRIMLGSNNYLGLTDHPAVKEAAIKAIEKYGTGAGGVRVLSGTMDLHKELEEKIAKFKGAEASILLPSGYTANLSATAALLKKDDVVLNDGFNHASIVDGCRATEATIRFYKHCDLTSLERKLKQYDFGVSKLIITDGVFSMDGDIAPLKEITELAKKYNALVMVDDAHSTGVIGKTGRGTAEHHDVLGKVDVTIVTLSKALAGVGGAVCGPTSLINCIGYLSRSFVFSSALPPSVCASVIAALNVIMTEPQIVRQLHKNRDFLYSGLKDLGYNVVKTETAIIPVIIGPENKTYHLANALYARNVFVTAVARPAVPRELSRLRVSVMATHTSRDLQMVLDAFEKSGKELGII